MLKSRQNFYFSKELFLISVRRSGSSFLSALIRSHPEILFFNEIITRSALFLPTFHGACLEETQDLKDAFVKDLNKLMRYKIIALGNIVNRYRVLKVPAMGAFKLMNFILSKLGQEEKNWNLFYKIYNMNALVEPPFREFIATQFYKTKNPSILFIKEARRHRAWFLLKNIYPQGYFIHLIRNPFGVVSSEIRFHKNDQDMFAEAELDKRTRQQYSNLLDNYVQSNFVQRVALNWRVSNELIARDIEENQTSNNLVITYESIVENIDKNIRRVFDFIGLELSTQTKRFLEQLKTAGNIRKHDRSVFFKKTNSSLIPKDLSTEQIDDIYKVVADSFLMKIWK